MQLAAARGEGPYNWCPVVDGTPLPACRIPSILPRFGDLSAAVPLLIGSMHDEAVFFERDNPQFFSADEGAVKALAHRRLGAAADRILAVYRRGRSCRSNTPVERAIAIETAVVIGNDTVALADRKSLQAAPVYRYRDDYRSNVPVKGTNWNTARLPYCQRHRRGIRQLRDPRPAGRWTRPGGGRESDERLFRRLCAQRRPFRAGAAGLAAL